MLTGSNISTPLDPLAHGGDLAAARLMFPDAPEPFVDLSTGINPHPYPLPALPPDAFSRLPDRTAIRRLAAAAARCYGAPSEEHVTPAPGTQMMLPMVAALAAPGRAMILRTSYAEHARAALLAGHGVSETDSVARLGEADLAIAVNPNNPDGRIVSKQALLNVADDLQKRGGVLVIDESFADVAPAGTSLARDVVRDNVVVLRSFGKFFGLAGLRLGFALASPPLVCRLDAQLGPWAVSGAAIAIGERALTDTQWQDETRGRLAKDAARLDGIITAAGLSFVGGTSLYRLTQSPDASALFERLGRAGILVRRFAEEPTWLRFGLPRDESEWRRLGAALPGR